MHFTLTEQTPPDLGVVSFTMCIFSKIMQQETSQKILCRLYGICLIVHDTTKTVTYITFISNITTYTEPNSTKQIKTWQTPNPFSQKALVSHILPQKRQRNLKILKWTQQEHELKITNYGFCTYFALIYQLNRLQNIIKWQFESW